MLRKSEFYWSNKDLQAKTLNDNRLLMLNVMWVNIAISEKNK